MISFKLNNLLKVPSPNIITLVGYRFNICILCGHRLVPSNHKVKCISSLLLDLSHMSAFLRLFPPLCLFNCYSSTAQFIIISSWELSLTSMIRWNTLITLLFYVLILSHAFLLEHFHNCQLICARTCSRSVFLFYSNILGANDCVLCAHNCISNIIIAPGILEVVNSSFLSKKINMRLIWL